MRFINAPLTRRALLGVAALSTLPTAWAQEYPARPIRIVIGAPAGSLPDFLVRLLGEEIKADLGQPFIVDNKPGASGTIAADTVAKSPADGYTLLFANDALLTVNPLIFSKLPYDTVKDLKPASLLGATGGVIVASPRLGVKTLPEFVRLVQSKPGAINYASGGAGHPTQLAMELLMQATGMKMTHVPYRGTPQAVQAIIGGEVDVLFTGYVEVLPHIKSGRLVALGSTGAAAKLILPEVALVKESVPGFEFETWFSLMAPAGTPDAVLQRFNAAVERGLSNPTLKQKWFEQGVTARSGGTTVVQRMIDDDAKRYGPLVKSLGIKVD